MKYCLITLAFLSSCQSDKLDEVLQASKTPRLDLVYYAVVRSNMEEFGATVAIVDKTLDSTSTKVNGVNTVIDKKENIYWKKSIFPNSDYISGDSLEVYINRNSDRYWELRNSYESGWIELTVPLFTQEDDKVIIEVRYYGKESFSSSAFYVLEWKGNKYEIIEKGLISIS